MAQFPVFRADSCRELVDPTVNFFMRSPEKAFTILYVLVEGCHSI
jgi:hypothetical protein